MELSAAEPCPPPDHTSPVPPSVLVPRLFIGLVVLTCAEVFSGASVKVGLWHPWTWIMTYWLYFAHFFFFTTIAVKTRRTSLPSLYLWGVLFGLYEGWITKVIWHGYSGDGKFLMGTIGPFGFSETSMVFFFHPIVSFILPLTVIGLLSPTTRSLFPDLPRLDGSERWIIRGRRYLECSFIPIMAMNSGGPVNLALNLAFILGLLAFFFVRSRSRLSEIQASDILVFGRRGFQGLCLYLVLLYGVTYYGIRPDGLPGPGVQILTLAIYGLVGLGLARHAPGMPPEGAVRTDPVGMTSPPLASGVSVSPELDAPERILRMRATLLRMFLLSLIFSPLAGHAILCIPIVLNFLVWTLGGLLLTARALISKGIVLPEPGDTFP